jgi:hypothetical protein
MKTITPCKEDNGIPHVCQHLDADGYPELFFVKCYVCATNGMFEYTVDEAIDSWNEEQNGKR